VLLYQFEARRYAGFAMLPCGSVGASQAQVAGRGSHRWELLPDDDIEQQRRTGVRERSWLRD
jgi:hypothetical protein